MASAKLRKGAPNLAQSAPVLRSLRRHKARGRKIPPMAVNQVTQPTPENVDSARAEWLREVRNGGLEIAVRTVAALAAIQMIFNKDAYTEYTKGEVTRAVTSLRMKPVLTSDELLTVVTALVVLIVTITIATMASPPIDRQTSLHDQVALFQWKVASQQLSWIATSIALAVATSSITTEPGLALVLISVVSLVGALAALTVISVRDRRFVGLARAEIHRLNEALKWLSSCGYPESLEGQKKRRWGWVKTEDGEGWAPSSTLCWIWGVSISQRQLVSTDSYSRRSWLRDEFSRQASFSEAPFSDLPTDFPLCFAVVDPGRVSTYCLGRAVVVGKKYRPYAHWQRNLRFNAPSTPCRARRRCVGGGRHDLQW